MIDLNILRVVVIVSHALVEMALLESVFNHLVLPPKLPGQLDIDIEGIEHNVLTRLIYACDTLGKLAGQDFGESWASIRRSLVTCVNGNPRHLDKQSILRGFSQLQSNDVLILYLVEQNAALLLRHHVQSVFDLRNFIARFGLRQVI